MKSQIDDLTRTNQELKNAKDRLGSENTELQRQLHDLDMSSGNLTKTKAQLQHQLDEAKSKLEEESRVNFPNDFKHAITTLMSQFSVNSAGTRRESRIESYSNIIVMISHFIFVG